MQVCFSGKFVDASTPIFTADNRGFRYGDGVFETARVANGSLLLAGHHFERLLQGLGLLQIAHAADLDNTLLQLISELCGLNSCSASAKVRLAVFRGANSEAEYVIEATPVKPFPSHLNPHGWAIGLYNEALKTCDAFSNLKTANYLPYVMAQRFALEKGLDECIVLNSRRFIADGSKTNLFVLHGNEVYTPPLSAGCVNGVMRKYVISRLRALGCIVKEEDLEVANVIQASEVFMTNAIEGIRWVKSFGTAHYGNRWLEKMYVPLFEDIL
jgi:branched-chain amino acid aminotransferase